MTHNHFRLEPSAVVSFSGGRTSGLMLRRILDAHDGKLPDGVVAVFCNTGKERPETLDFVERVSLEWGVFITWLEYRWEPGRHYFVEVNYATASRNGEPFRHAIEARGFLPNPVARFCTVELKMLTLNRYVRQALGWEKYTNAVGLRADEGRRVRKARPNVYHEIQPALFGPTSKARKVKAKSGRPTGETVAFPLHDAGVTLADVTAFWAAQPFDLALTQDEGNCDLCFLKGAGKILGIMQDRPELAEWWAESETLVEHPNKPGTARFRADRPGYRELQMIATDQQDGPGWLWSDRNTGACGEIDECRCTD